MALGDGSAWDETTPTDATNATSIDDYNRDLRLGVRSRMALEHEWPASQSATSEAGKHKFITFQTQGSAPTLAGTQDGSIFLGTDNIVRVETALASSLPVPRILQIVHTQTGKVVSCATTITADDSIPQITEGNEVITLTITPIGATSKLLVEAVGNLSQSVDYNMAMAIFQGTTANALAASWVGNGAFSSIHNVKLSHEMTPATTAATVFRLRAGGLTSGTVTVNGVGGARKFGGVMNTGITITEVAR